MKRSVLLALLLSIAAPLLAQPGGLIRDSNFSVSMARVQALGYRNIDNLPGLYGDAATVSAISNNFPNVAGSFYNFLYDSIFLIQTRKDADLTTLAANPSQNTELYYTLRALQLLRDRYPRAYAALVTDAIHSDLTALDNNAFNFYVNRFSHIVISFNNVSNSIAISGTMLGATATRIAHNGVDYTVWNNLPVISINPDLIAGTDPASGSAPVYRRAQAADNYSLYLREGLLHSIVHELVHRALDIRNNDRRTIYNYFCYGPARVPVKYAYQHPQYDMEEIVLSRTINHYFRNAGGLSDELLRYYDGAEQEWTQRISPFYYRHFMAEMRPKTGFDPQAVRFRLLD